MIEQKNDTITLSKAKSLDVYFIDVDNKAKRNSIVSLAYLDGYSQIKIAKYLRLSKSSISMIIGKAKSGDSTAGVQCPLIDLSSGYTTIGYIMKSRHV